MALNTDIVKYQLYTIEKGYEIIPEPINYDTGIRDVIERDSKSKSFTTSKKGAIELYGEAFNYIVALQAVYGILPNLKLIESRKSDDRIDQRWKVVSQVNLDLGTCDFDYNRRVIKIKTTKGGLIEEIESRFDDEYDVLNNEIIENVELEDLKRVDVRLDSRKIFRRSKLFVDGVAKVVNTVSGGDRLNARAIPLKIDYNSDKENIQNVLGVRLNANNNQYATVESSNSANLFYLIADRDKTIRISGTVNTRMVRTERGSMSLDLVRYKTENLNFDEVIKRLDTCNTGNYGEKCSYTFDEYEVELKKGDSLAIATLTDTRDGVDYEAYDTEIIVEEDNEYPTTYTKAVKPFDLFERLIAVSTEREKSFYSDLFGEGGKYENTLIAHGSWIRNMPRILNKGKDDEKVVQASTSLSDLYSAFEIREPLMYGVKKINNKEVFYTETEKHTQRNFVAIKLGETREDFNLIPVSKEIRKVIPKNYYSSINIGSEKTGSEYGEVNNLYSICGNAQWNTINKNKKSEYKVLTKYRTGSVDVELTRQKQYSDNPDLDSDYDNDWFLLDCKYNGTEYELKKWEDFYTTEPKNVYSVETEYNWMFTPYELLKGHGWKIKSGLIHYPGEKLKFISSNCTGNIITEGFKHDNHVPHSTLEKARYVNMSIDFNLFVNQEISDMLKGETNGIDNKFGLVEFLSEGEAHYARLIKVDENKEGKFELIEAIL